jgi:hypothetical protein
MDNKANTNQEVAVQEQQQPMEISKGDYPLWKKAAMVTGGILLGIAATLGWQAIQGRMGSNTPPSM